MGGSICNTNLVGSEALIKLIKLQNLHGTWWKVSPDKSEFTYHRIQSNIHSRLDGIYATQNIDILNSKIMPFQHSDHEVLLTKFVLRIRNQVAWYWKLNTFILTCETFKTAFKNFWHDCQQQKNLPMTNFPRGINKKIIPKNACDTLLCNNAKKKKKNKNLRNKQEQLTQFLTTEKTKQNPDQNKRIKAQQHLQDMQNYKTTGSIIRRKEKLIIEQEKPNKLSFGQRKQKQKTIKHLQKVQNNKTAMITNDFEILKY